MKEESSPLYMTQEAIAESLPPVGPLDQPGDVHYGEGLKLVHLDYAEMRLQGGEGVRGNFGTSGRDRGDKG